MRVKVGVTLPQFTDDPGRLIDAAHRAVEAGLDSIFLFDHLWPLGGGKQRPLLECWTSLAYLAAATDDIAIGTLVTRSSLRHPAVLAKMAATISEIAAGRLIVAIGTGDELSRPENEAFGLPFFTGDDRVAQLESTVAVVRSFLAGGEVDRRDDFVRVEGLPASPAGPQAAPVWVGGRSPGVLALAGRLADGWNGWGAAPDAFARMRATVDRAAGDRVVEATWGGLVALGSDDADARARLGDRDPAEWVVGGPEAVQGHLAAVAEAGASHLICTFPDAGRRYAGRPDAYELLGAVADGLR